MKKKFTSFTAIFLAAIMTVGMLPASALAANDETVDNTEGPSDVQEFDTIYQVNPLYEDIISESDLVQAEEVDSGIATLSSAAYTDSLEEAAEQLREDMVSRDASTTIKYIYTDGTSISNSTLTGIAMELMEVALEHTGVSTEGDYLRWQYAGWGLSASARSSSSEKCVYLDMKFTITYYTSYEEEQAVTSELENVFAELNLGCESDYDRVCAIYDYICNHVTYDYAHLSDPTYYTQYTAYGALIDGTSVCQGYAVLLYRMMLEAGVDCRVITGNGAGDAHAWNIVCLNGKYYNVDATWDAGKKSYAYFLLPDATFTSHERGSEYTGTFSNEYPMATSAYDASKETSEDHHTPGDWEVIEEPTCTEDGLEVQKCAVCGAIIEEELIPALGHDYVEETTEPTCENDGHVVQICIRCEETNVKEILPATGHSYEVAEVVEPTCTEGGYTEYTCSVCGDTYEGDHTDPLGHEYVEDSVSVEATCTEQGEVIDVCERCNESYIERYTDPLGHEYVDGVCVRCGWIEGEEDPEHHHDFQETSKVDATCGEDGLIVYVCECGEEDDEIIPATGEHTYVENETKEASCESNGYVSYTCEICGDTYEDEIPKTGHEFESEGVTVDATCTEDGSVSFICSNCGYEYSEVIPAPGHEWVESDDGTLVCERCGEVEPGTEPGPEEPEEPDDLEPTEIGKYDITEAVVSGVEEHYEYTGEEVKPVPVITYNGNVLTEGVDYELNYIHDVEIGYASIAIVGIGDYYGDIILHYTIAENVDKSELQSEYDQDEELKESDYTAESWSAFVTARADAATVLASEDATQAAVYEALNALRAAREALEPTAEKAERDELQEEVDSDLELNEDDYTSESWEEFEEALEHAEDVLADENATFEELEEALEKLEEAREALEPVVTEPEPEPEPVPEDVDKTELQDKVDEAEKLKESDYTAESWKAFEEALANAETVLADEYATQEEVYEALAALLEAEESLEKIGQGSGTNGTGSTGSTGSGSSAPKTADTNDLGIWVALMIACAVIMGDVCYIKKRAGRK